jgi:hypothetical protein
MKVDSKFVRGLAKTLGLGHKKMACLAKSNWLVSGFHFDKSRHGETYYIYLVAQPLFIKADSLVLSYGGRIKSSSDKEAWSDSDILQANGDVSKHLLETLLDYKRNVVDSLTSESGVTSFCELIKGKVKSSVIILEAYVMAQVILPISREDKLKWLDALLSEYKNIYGEQPQVEWQSRAIRVASDLRHLIENGKDPLPILMEVMRVTESHIFN